MKINFADIPEPGDRYQFGVLLGQGVYGTIYSASDLQASNKKVAIKCQKYETGSKEFVEEEYKILRDLSTHVNIIDFYGIFKKSNEILFVLEPCEGGSVIDLVNRLFAKNRRMAEEHIAYVIKETVRGLMFLHENKVIHRDIKASNILLTLEGEVKLCDFGLSKVRHSIDENLSVILGSPSWMAPELVTIGLKKKDSGYTDRVDVWSLGITAIELGDGKAPFEKMHPSRALFQIVANPPPSLQKISNWTENFHDFISECLVKDFEYRPCIMELIEHPFLEDIPENNYHLAMEIKCLLSDVGSVKLPKKKTEVVVHGKFLKRGIDDDLEPIYEEDLAAIHPITERDILEILEKRAEKGEYFTYIGDILLSLNPNEKQDIYGNKFHSKYNFKSRSDNAPHIYTIADTAYQNALHHKTIQQIVLSGESGSGKTTNYLHLIDHLFFVGENNNVNAIRIKNAVKLIHSLIHASTSTNVYSTRAVFKTEVTYGKTGKLSGASFKVHCIEKSRVSLNDGSQSNFHIFYYIYDGLVASSMHDKYYLNSNREYNYLKNIGKSSTNLPMDDLDSNRLKHKKICSYLDEFEFSEEQLTTIHSIIAAILHLGEAIFEENDEMYAVIKNRKEIEHFAELLEVDEKKISWALTNYCAVKDGNAFKVRQTCDESREHRNVLANTLYARLVDYIVGTINNKLSFGKAIFGNTYSVKILDFFGFECFKKNGFAQLLVNTFNEQLHYHFLQRVFAWELQDLQDENIEYIPVCYYNNKDCLNEILGNPEGLFSIIDDAAKKGHGGRYITDILNYDEKKKVLVYDENNITIVHYTGKVTYNCKQMSEKNRDFLPPEIIETLRSSKNPIISTMFTSKLDRTGNLIMVGEDVRKTKFGFQSKAATERQYSQIKKMRTQSAIFKSLCLELLKELSVGSGSGSTHFVRCVRSDLKGVPHNFKRELVKQQIRAMGVVDTAKIRQKGFSQRISFTEFLRRYKFLAFDFDENVDITKDNCRLLMIRLKMEGWALGKSKIFLKYYNEEYLSRLYETQVKKIIKIQSILRGFLVKCRLAKKDKEEKRNYIEQMKGRRRSSAAMTEDEAAEVIQKAYRNATKRKQVLETYKQLSETELKFIKPFFRKWRNQTIFSVLMRYRGKRIQEFFNLSQQVHLYNMNVYHKLQQTQEGIDVDNIDKKAQVSAYLDEVTNSVLKLNFRLEDIPFYNTSHMPDLLTNIGELATKEEPWDGPYRWRESRSQTKEESTDDDMEHNEALSNINFKREPDEDLLPLPSPVESDEGKDIKESINNATKLKTNKKFSYESNETKVKDNYSQVNLRKVENSYATNGNTDKYLVNSSPANRDFDYIKAKPITVKPKYTADPIAELRKISRRDSNTSEDDPPFNFQGMLRKTNFRKSSLKDTIETVRRLSITKNQDNIKRNDIPNGYFNDESVYGKHVSLEIMPGLIMEGLEVEL